MKLLNERLFFILILLSLSFIFPSQLFASNYIIVPHGQTTVQPVTIPQGQTSKLDIIIDPTNQSVIGGQFVFDLSPSIAEFDSYDDAHWFDQLIPKNTITKQSLYIKGIFDLLPCLPTCSDSKSKNTLGTVATITVKALTAGNATINIRCDPTPDTSTILIRNPLWTPSTTYDKNNPDTWYGKNSIDCSKNKASTITITGGSPTPTVTPGGPPVPTATDGPPLPTGEPTCDLCGACKDKNGVLLKPNGYDQCYACLYKPDKQPKTGFSWTALGCIKTDQGGAGPLVSVLLMWVTRIAGGITFLFILYGGYLVLTSQGDVVRLQQGKRTIIGAIGALIIIFFAVFLLQFVGMNVLGIPSFK